VTPFEAWQAKCAERTAAGGSTAPAPAVVDMTDPRAAMRAAGWGGEDATASSEPPGTGVGRGNRIADAIQGDDWQAERVAEAKVAKGKRRVR
jgi:hypothetical protein